MPPLSYVGAPQAAATDLVNKAYVSTVTAANMTQASVDSLLTSGFSGYVTKSYVDTRDALNATPAFVDAGDTTRLHLSQLGANNGIAGLDSSGKVAVARVPVAGTQRWPKPFISPSAYNASTVTATATESQVYTVAVADPGFVYKLLITGMVDATSDTDGQYPAIRVRQGSTTGPIVAIGNGVGENYFGRTQPTSFTTVGTSTYTKPSGYTNFDVIALGGGGSSSLSTWHGLPGTFGSASGVANASVPATLSVTVGAGGTGGGAGTSSTVTGTGFTTVTGTGGAGNNSAVGTTSPGTLTVHGLSYVGGADVPSSGAGNAPGGGARGVFAGAPGRVWILAYDSTVVSGGPVSIMPTAFNLQATITGATTLYVMLGRSGTSGTMSASTLRPALYVVPIPA